MVKRLNGSKFLTAAYGVSVIIFGFVAFSAVTNAHIIWQAETALGHPISCLEAYHYRAIDSYFYFERFLQGIALYFYGLLSPCLLPAFLVFTGVIASKVLIPESSLRFNRPLTVLMGIGTALILILLAYGSVIYLVACATE